MLVLYSPILRKYWFCLPIFYSISFFSFTISILISKRYKLIIRLCWLVISDIMSQNTTLLPYWIWFGNLWKPTQMFPNKLPTPRIMLPTFQNQSQIEIKNDFEASSDASSRDKVQSYFVVLTNVKIDADGCANDNAARQQFLINLQTM